MIISPDLRAQIHQRWIDTILSAYAAESARFFRNEQNRFANPVGSIIQDEAGGLLDAVLVGFDAGAIREPLDRVVRVRAVQELAPAQALGFLFDLKALIRRAVEESDEVDLDPAELTAVEARVDLLALLAMDIYVECRERIFEIRVNEIRNSSFKVLERMQEWRVARAERTADDVETQPGE